MSDRKIETNSGEGATFSVEDMSCNHCVATIEKALKAGLPGAQFTIDLENQRVFVAGDPKAAETVIRDAGYEPKLLEACSVCGSRA
jgi:copper chaperone